MKFSATVGKWLNVTLDRKGLFKLCITAGLLIGLLAHGFMFTNKIPNHDDLYYDVDITGVGVESGRFALLFFWKMFSNLSTPWLNGVLGILFLSGAVFLLADTFDLRRRWQALSAALVLVVFPENISIYCFMYEAHIFMLGILLAALVPWTVRRGRYGWLWAVLPLLLATGIYQVFLLLAVGLLLCLMIYDTARLGRGWTLALRCAATALLGLLLYLLTVKLTLRLTGTELNQYQGMDKMGALDLSALPEKLALAYQTVWDYFFADVPIYFVKLMRLAQGLLASLGLVAALGLCGRAFVQRRPMEGVLLLGCVALLPLCAAGIYFMGDDIVIHSLVLYPLVLLLLLPVAVGPFAMERLPRLPLRRGAAAMLLAGSLLYGFEGAVLSNQAYYKQYLAYSRGAAFANRLAERIERADGYTPEMTVALYGYVNGHLPEWLVYFEPEDTFRFTPMSGMNTELDYVNFLSMPKMLRRVAGLPVNAVSDWQPATDEERAQLEAMSGYPAEGSVAVIGDVCVVKFGSTAR